MPKTPLDLFTGKIEAALSYIFIDIPDPATSVSVALLDNGAIAGIKDPGLFWENTWFHRLLGALSIAAGIPCEGLTKFVRIKYEGYEREKARIEPEVLD